MRCIPCGRPAAEGYEQQQRHGTAHHRINSIAFGSTPTNSSMQTGSCSKKVLQVPRYTTQYTKAEVKHMATQIRLA